MRTTRLKEWKLMPGAHVPLVYRRNCSLRLLRSCAAMKIYNNDNSHAFASLNDVQTTTGCVRLNNTCIVISHDRIRWMIMDMMCVFSRGMSYRTWAEAFCGSCIATQAQSLAAHGTFCAAVVSPRQKSLIIKTMSSQR